MPEIKIENYPYKLDNTVLPWPDNPPEMKYAEVEKVSVSEGGTDIVQTTRLGKLSMTFSYQLPGSWSNTFETFYSSNNTITVSIPNNSATGYETKTMRMRGYSKKLVKGSEKLTGVVGVFQYKFTLIEM